METSPSSTTYGSIIFLAHWHPGGPCPRHACLGGVGAALFGPLGWFARAAGTGAETGRGRGRGPMFSMICDEQILQTLIAVNSKS